MSEPENGNGHTIVVAEPIHPWRWRLLTAWVVAFSIIVAYGFLLIQRQVDRNAQAKTALCSYAANLQEQVDQSRQYLADVEAGRRPRIQGITDEDITLQVRRQQAVLDSLDDLHCA